MQTQILSTVFRNLRPDPSYETVKFFAHIVLVEDQTGEPPMSGAKRSTNIRIQLHQMAYDDGAVLYEGHVPPLDHPRNGPDLRNCEHGLWLTIRCNNSAYHICGQILYEAFIGKKELHEACKTGTLIFTGHCRPYMESAVQGQVTVVLEKKNRQLKIRNINATIPKDNVLRYLEYYNC